MWIPPSSKALIVFYGPWYLLYTMIYWYKPSVKLPTHNEQVLVRHGDSIDLATFDADKQRLVLRDGKFFTKEDKVTWMKLLSDMVA